MPIKFRCQHCRQFLGISRSKAGSVTDCPMCGRTIRIPELDGTVKSLPKPGLDMQDSQLANALDELASIENPDRALAGAAVGSGGDGDQNVVVSARAEPEPIELEPLPEPEAVEVESPLPPAGSKKLASVEAASAEDAERPWAETAQPGDSWKKLIAAAQAGPDSVPDKDESKAGPAQVTPGESLPSEPVTPSAGQGTAGGRLSRKTSPAFLCAVGGIAAIVFAVGFWVGRITTIQPGGTAQTGGGSVNDDSSSSLPGAEDDQSRPVAFRGRVTFRTESGERKPDQGARIIVFPVDRSGSSRLPVAGFLSQATSQDHEIALGALRRLGGDAAVANESGEYQVSLPQAGEFHVLVLSNSLSREDDADAGNDQTLIAEYFFRPEQLLGRLEYQLDRVRYTGEGTDTLDYSLPRG